MLDFPLKVKLPVVDRIHPCSNKFAADIENKATGGSKLNVILVYGMLFYFFTVNLNVLLVV